MVNNSIMDDLVYKYFDETKQIKGTSKPVAPKIYFENIPEELKVMPNWTLWKYVLRKGKWTKVPFQLNKSEGDSSDPSKWTTFEKVINAFNNNRNIFDGIGFTFSPSDPFSGIDFDNCIDKDGNIDSIVEQYLKVLNSYSEISPSGKGIKVFTKAKLPVEIESNGKIQQGFARKKVKPEVEVYYGDRFFTITGNILQKFPKTIEERNNEQTGFFKKIFEDRKYFGKKTSKETISAKVEIREMSPTEADDELQKLFEIDETFKNNYCVPATEGNRSDNEFYLCVRMFEAGFDGKSVLRLMDAGPQSRWNGESDSYKRRTIRKAKEKVALNAREMLKTPVILGSNLYKIVEDTLEALYKYNNPPEIFQRAGSLCRIKTIDTKKNRHTIENLSPHALRIEMSKAAIFRRKKSKDAYKEVPPEKDLANCVLANRSWDFPSLNGITNAPMIRSDGTILDVPGYDDATGFYYMPDVNLDFPEIPDTLTNEDAINAAKFIMDEILIDFPFVDNASRENMIGAFLSPLVRPMINGSIPICLIDKPSPGTGASKLVELISLIATGENMKAVVAPRRDEEEWKKLITSLLREAQPIICLDNIESDIKSGNLASVLTSQIWKSRLLGTSESIELPNLACWYATGNKLVLDGDIPRRGYLIQLDAKLEHPWERKTDFFKKPNINQWVRDNRGLILSKLLIMASAWVQAGRPSKETDRSIGNFEDWVDIIGSILNFAGLNNFLGNLDHLYENLASDNWTPFLTTWANLFGDKQLKSSDILEMIEREEFINCTPEAIAVRITGNKAKDITEIGKILKRQVGIIRSNGLRLVKKQDPHTKSSLWKVLGKEENPPRSQSP